MNTEDIRNEEIRIRAENRLLKSILEQLLNIELNPRPKWLTIDE